MASRYEKTRSSAQRKCLVEYDRRYYLVRYGKASWVIRRYSVEEACARAGL
jgi:hypothetical protein